MKQVVCGRDLDLYLGYEIACRDFIDNFPDA